MGCFGGVFFCWVSWAYFFITHRDGDFGERRESRFRSLQGTRKHLPPFTGSSEKSSTQSCGRGYVIVPRRVITQKWMVCFEKICAMVKSRVFLGMGNLPPLMTESL